MVNTADPLKQEKHDRAFMSHPAPLAKPVIFWKAGNKSEHLSLVHSKKKIVVSKASSLSAISKTDLKRVFTGKMDDIGEKSDTGEPVA